ncbi:MAG: Type IV-A pilus assembly ATPase PilB [candidate division WWE3 bacterium GW2011_GWA1_46_21]|uniref:Type IV-A pilus assembly ATPase PilB n=3 Tax=Katanobacteria TaxID=422282 RepID=A0A0G1PD86_UNCKA|nr:MAG: Type IV-A pilus assembly ATPase PilB [candidate division WWE3 bacterium GW2011_GWA1_46_21]KKU49780.1 MAG: general secretory pathway protein E, type IV pilus assembly protein PilB [candidate division WWE3 bacterium GW2011_GWC1_47_10]
MPKATAQKEIEDVLFDKQLITTDQLSAVKFEHVNTGKPSEEIIKERGYVTNEDYVKALGEVYGFEYVKLSEIGIDPELEDIIPSSVAKKYGIVPFALKDKKLSVAMLDPLDLQTIEFVERKTGYKVLPFIASTKEIEAAVEEQHGKAMGEEISAALEEITQTTLKIEEGNGDLTQDEATLRDAPIARVVGMILETAVKTGASDVHIEPGEDKSRLRYRVDGILEEKRTIPKEMHDSVIARIKILAQMKIDEKRLPQDGRFKVQVGKSKTDLRVSTLPTIYGEKVVIRLLKEEGVVHSFRDLGLRGLSLKRMEEAILKPTGMILVSGPTGSGKTVTLASALAKLNTVRVNIVSVEDPVEIRIPGVNQVQINPQAGLTFASGLRSFLRQDPNIIMVGEIRDSETAELAIHAALTGHLVLSTLHTNSAAGAIPRMLDMNVENFLLASTLNAVLAQRLVRKICEECKEPYDPPSEVIDDIKSSLMSVENSQVLMSKDKDIAENVKKVRAGKISVFRGKGCDKCGKTGYKGRTGIFEVMEISEAIGHLTLEHSPEEVIRQQAVKEGMLTLIQDGYLKVLEGVTTIEEVLRVSKG